MERNRCCTTLTRPWPDLNRLTIEIQMNYTKHLLAVAALAGPLLCAQDNRAENTETPPAALPQLQATTVVTGTLWESELQKTTASVSVLDADRIQDSGTQHFGDLINSIPNLTWTGGSSRPRYLQIRGIGENSQFEGETPDSSVRFLIDDLDLTGLGTVGNLFDVQQVEVLRGPQAGAFGANAAGGVIKIVTNQPTPYWTGQVEGTIGNDNLRSGGLAIGGPLLESDPEALTFRLSLHQLTQDGFRDNRFLNQDDTNERDELTTRLKLRWLANEDWQWDGTLFFADTNNGYDEWTLGNTEFDTYSDQPGRDVQESFGTSLRGTWTGLDDVEVTSITSFVNTDSLNSFDGDWTDAATAAGLYGTSFLIVNRDRNTFSQEIRFNSIDAKNALGWIDRWTAGVYYQNFNENTDTTGFGNFSTKYKSQTFSTFGQITKNLGDKTRVSLGLRAENFDLDTELDFRNDVSFNDWLLGGKIALEHDLNSNNLIFASITRGYKAGGANIYPFLAATLPTKYDTETLWNYEGGIRSSFFDGAVISQLTVFYLDRDNPQLRDSDGANVSFTYFTTNGEAARHYGAEAEATWYINENWSIYTSLGLLKATRDSYTDPSDSTLTIPSRSLSNAPSYNYSARIDYKSDNGLFANMEVTGSASYYESNSHTQKRSDFAVVNSAIGYNYQNWTLTLWVQNLLDERYEKRVFYFDNGYGDKRYENPADPQHFGVTLNYSW